jgi:hypothetical protein
MSISRLGPRFMADAPAVDFPNALTSEEILDGEGLLK